ncbi:MAG: hypothetical protein RML35_15465 [Chloroherpetonaceae bacterium]|nr:hypothetical protein [Chloroherpetonaceae bacterium]
MPEENLPTPAKEQPDNFTAVMWGAAVVVITSLVPYLSLINFCCLGVMIGGAVATFQYTSAYQLTLKGGEGFKLGALAGLVGGVAYYALFLLLQTLFDYQLGAEEWRQLLLSLFGSDPAAREQIEEALRTQQQEGLTVLNVIIGLGLTLILYPLAGGIGGAVGAALFQKGEKNESA